MIKQNSENAKVWYTNSEDLYNVCGGVTKLKRCFTPVLSGFDP